MNRPARALRDLSRRLFERLFGAGGDPHLRALLSQRRRARASESLAGRGHDGAAPLDSEIHTVIPPPGVRRSRPADAGAHGSGLLRPGTPRGR